MPAVFGLAAAAFAAGLSFSPATTNIFSPTLSYQYPEGTVASSLASYERTPEGTVASPFISYLYVGRRELVFADKLPVCGGAWCRRAS